MSSSKSCRGPCAICLTKTAVVLFHHEKQKRQPGDDARGGSNSINKGISKKVLIVARVDIPHSNEKVFVSKSGGKYTIGLKVWKADYTWSEKNQMWVAKH